MKMEPLGGGFAGTASVVRIPMNTLGSSTAYSIRPGPLTRPEVTLPAGRAGIAPHSSSVGPNEPLVPAAPIPASAASPKPASGEPVVVSDDPALADIAMEP